MDKILTISVAAYNAEKYLDIALGSIVASNYLNRVQIIIVNDGSIDQTSILATKWKNEYPDSIIVIDKENGGYGSTINAAIKVASGKYFKLLDADDWFETKELDKLIQSLEELEVDLVISDYYEHNCSTGIKTAISVLKNEYNKIYPIENLTNININPALTVKTSVLKSDKFQINISEKCYYTDLEYCIKAILQAHDYYYIRACVYCYLIGRKGQSVSVDGRVKHIDDHDHVVRVVTNAVLLSSSSSKAWKMLLIDNIYTVIHGHVIWYSLYTRPSKKNVKKFISFSEFVKKNVPEVVDRYSDIRKFIMHPYLTYVPKCLLNRFKARIKQLLKR